MQNRTTIITPGDSLIMQVPLSFGKEAYDYSHMIKRGDRKAVRTILDNLFEYSMDAYLGGNAVENFFFRGSTDYEKIDIYIKYNIF